MPSTVTAIIPTFNRAAMLRECIDSVLTQSRPVDEIIVVNDGSTDNTESVVKAYGERVKLLTKLNGGKASALNMALEQCTSDYIWICDDDDYAASDGLEALASALDNNHDAGIALGTFRIFYDDPTGRHFMPPTYWKREEEPNLTINFLEEMFTFQFAMLVRRPLYKSVGAFHNNMIRSEDYDTTLRLLQHTKAIYVPKIIFYQRRHSGLRGSADELFTVQENEIKWLEYDRKIFLTISREWPLREFTPTFALTWEPQKSMRAAFIERACVMAKRALWHEAISDLRQAASSTSERPTTDEKILAETIIRSPLPWQILAANKAWVNELRNIYELNAYGRDIIMALCRPLVWQTRTMLKHCDWRGSIRHIHLLFRIVGSYGALRRFLLTLFG